MGTHSDSLPKRIKPTCCSRLYFFASWLLLLLLPAILSSDTTWNTTSTPRKDKLVPLSLDLTHSLLLMVMLPLNRPQDPPQHPPLPLPQHPPLPPPSPSCCCCCSCCACHPCHSRSVRSSCSRPSSTPERPVLFRKHWSLPIRRRRS